MVVNGNASNRSICVSSSTTPLTVAAAPATMTTTPEVFNRAKVGDYFWSRFISVDQNVEQFYADQGVQRMARIVFLAEQTPTVKINKDAVLVKCCSIGSDEGCQLFRLLQNARQQQREDYCDHCYLQQRSHKRRQQRKRTYGDRTDTSSKAPLASLSPPSLLERTRNVVTLNRATKKKITRLLLKDLNERDAPFNIDDKNIYDVLTECLKHCDNNATEMQTRVLTILVETAKGCNIEANDSEAMEQLSEYTSELCAEISNYALQLSNKPKLVRFNSHVLRSALAFWLESPSAYERLREHSIQILPSIKRLQQLQRQWITREGNFPPTYGWFLR